MGNEDLGKLMIGIDKWVNSIPELVDTNISPPLLVESARYRGGSSIEMPFRFSLHCCGRFGIPEEFVSEMLESTLRNVLFMSDWSNRRGDIHDSILDTSAVLRWTAPEWFDDDLYGEHMLTAIWLTSQSIGSNSEQELSLEANEAYRIATYVGQFINASRELGQKTAIAILKSSNDQMMGSSQSVVEDFDKNPPFNVLTNSFLLHFHRMEGLDRYGVELAKNGCDHIVTHFLKYCRALTFGYGQTQDWSEAVSTYKIPSGLPVSYMLMRDSISFKRALPWARHGLNPSDYREYADRLEIDPEQAVLLKGKTPDSWINAW